MNGRSRPMEVEELEIDESDDFGSDPYNRTGSHCVLELGEDAWILNRTTDSRSRGDCG